MNSLQVNTLTLFFDAPLAPYEVPAFRGAIIDAVTRKNILFHNHDGDGLRFSYPLIQYKRIHSNAAIVCIGEGTEAIAELFQSEPITLNIGKRVAELKLRDIKANHTLVQVWNDMFSYRLYHYLPFNEDNYKAYMQAEGLVERYALIEKCLVGNILSMAKGLGIFFDQPIQSKITSCSEPILLSHKGVKMTAFDLTFTSNVSLPSHIGLGKAPAFGFGVLESITSQH